ncbi:NAD(P)H-binding protein [Bacillus subtilis]|nr:NAD(P)H-binding protein [Bacillus subtilis]
MTPLTPPVAILGAGGRAGRAITSTAVARGHAVTAIVRDPARHTDLHQVGVTVVAGDALDPASISIAAAGAQVLVSAVTPFTAPPATFDGFDTGFYARVADTLARAAEKNLIERVVVIGLFATLHTGGGGPVADDPDLFPPTLRPFADAHAAGVDRLRESGAGLDWLVLAPPPALGADAPSSGRYVLGDGTADPGRWETLLSYGDLATAVLDQIEQTTRRRELVAVYGT